MMILTRPSISPYLSRTLYELEEPVVLIDALQVPMRPALKIKSPAEVRKAPKLLTDSLVLTSFENGLHFFYEAAPTDPRVLQSRALKDKAQFRRELTKVYPDFYFHEATLPELERMDTSKVPFPVVIKPSTGISSIGVIRIASPSEWDAALTYVRTDLASYMRNYSADVVEAQKFLIEKWVSGTELAVDGYFDSKGAPVVLNILEHRFSGDNDTSDKLYVTSRAIVREHLQPIESFLQVMGKAFGLKRFPFHAEARRAPDGTVMPIEINPLRFSGLGTTEIAEYAHGVNVYSTFFRQGRPDWKRVLKNADPSVYGFICADIPTELFRKPGLGIDDRALFREFTEVLEYRLLSETETSTFAVIFFRTEDPAELDKILAMDFRKYLRAP